MEEVQEEPSLSPVDILKDKESTEPEEWHGNPSVESSAGRQNGPDFSTPEVTTAQAATQSQKKLVNKEAGENIYVEVPEIPIKYLVSNKMFKINLPFYAQVDALRHQTDFGSYDHEQQDSSSRYGCIRCSIQSIQDIF